MLQSSIHSTANYIMFISVFNSLILTSHLIHWLERFLSFQITFDKDYKMLTSKCECPVGKSKCSHIAAVYIHAYKNLSCTEVEVSWKKTASDETDIQLAADLFPDKRGKEVEMRLDVTAQDKGWLLAELTNYGKFTGN